MSGVLPSKAATGFVIMGFAVAQIVVHMIYFLHMNAKSDEGWTMVALVFTLILVVITLAGSLVGDASPQRQHDAGASGAGYHLMPGAVMKRWCSAIAAFCTAAGLLRCGVWQVERRAWKLAH